jgi:hypothetical protein
MSISIYAAPRAAPAQQKSGLSPTRQVRHSKNYCTADGGKCKLPWEGRREGYPNPSEARMRMPVLPRLAALAAYEGTAIPVVS